MKECGPVIQQGQLKFKSQTEVISENLEADTPKQQQKLQENYNTFPIITLRTILIIFGKYMGHVYLFQLSNCPMVVYYIVWQACKYCFSTPILVIFTSFRKKAILIKIVIPQFSMDILITGAMLYPDIFIKEIIFKWCPAFCILVEKRSCDEGSNRGQMSKNCQKLDKFYIFFSQHGHFIQPQYNIQLG